MIPTLLLAVSAQGAEVDFACTPNEGGLIVGLPPLEIHCVLEPPAVGSWEAATWTFGEGTLVEGEEVSFVYEETGQYTVTVKLEGYESPEDEASAPDPYEQKFGLVTVCGEPEVEFTYKNKGGLDYELLNQTTVAVHCIDQILWEIFEGRSTKGEPALVFDVWEPRFELPDEGPWTVRLTASGLAGASAAELVIDAKYQLTDDLTQGPKAYWCATGPSAAGGFGAWLVAALLWSRRRR